MAERKPLSERIGKAPEQKKLPAKTNMIEPDKRLIEVLTRKFKGMDDGSR